MTVFYATSSTRADCVANYAQLALRSQAQLVGRHVGCRQLLACRERSCGLMHPTDQRLVVAGHPGRRRQQASAPDTHIDSRS